MFYLNNVEGRSEFLDDFHGTYCQTLVDKLHDKIGFLKADFPSVSKIV